MSDYDWRDAVRLECLQDGVGDDWSIRAGLTARQRKNLRILSINEGVA